VREPTVRPATSSSAGVIVPTGPLADELKV
jgi:hypothetical protein